MQGWLSGWEAAGGGYGWEGCRATLILTLTLVLAQPLTLALVLALTVTLTLTSCGARVKAPPIALRSTEVVLRHLVIVGLG